MKHSHTFLTIEQFNTLLNKWNDKQIKISKVEMDDLDEVVMQLEKIAYKNEIPTIDGYEPIYNLQLNGEGMIQSEHNPSQPLPSSQYDIPLENNSLYEFDGTKFIVSTNRGTYKIERVD